METLLDPNSCISVRGILLQSLSNKKPPMCALRDWKVQFYNSFLIKKKLCILFRTLRIHTIKPTKFSTKWCFLFLSKTNIEWDMKVWSCPNRESLGSAYTCYFSWRGHSKLPPLSLCKGKGNAVFIWIKLSQFCSVSPRLHIHTRIFKTDLIIFLLCIYTTNTSYLKPVFEIRLQQRHVHTPPVSTTH